MPYADTNLYTWHVPTGGVNDFIGQITRTAPRNAGDADG